VGGRINTEWLATRFRLFNRFVVERPAVTVANLNALRVYGSIQHPQGPALQAHDHVLLVQAVTVRVEQHPESGHFGDGDGGGGVRRKWRRFRTVRVRYTAQDERKPAKM